MLAISDFYGLPNREYAKEFIRGLRELSLSLAERMGIVLVTMLLCALHGRFAFSAGWKRG